MSPAAPRARSPVKGGRLRIGDDWNAITIIALSQDNPLKAVAEFVENAIDSGASNVAITRGPGRAAARAPKICSQTRFGPRAKSSP